MTSDMKTFEQRMREHRQQYEQQRTAPNTRPLPRAEHAPAQRIELDIDLDSADEMYLHEQEDDKYITVDHHAGGDKEDMHMEPNRGRQQIDARQHMEAQQQTTRPVQRGMDISAERPVPETLGSSLYTPGFLRTQIGKLMRVEFLIGTNGLNDRTGILSEVGVSYIIVQSLDGISRTLCDIYSIKFVTIMESDDVNDLIYRI